MVKCEHLYWIRKDLSSSFCCALCGIDKDELNKGEDGYYRAIVEETFTTIGKRLAGLSGPGVTPVILTEEGEEEFYTQLFLEDRKGPSLALDYYKRIYGENCLQRGKKIWRRDPVVLLPQRQSGIPGSSPGRKLQYSLRGPWGRCRAPGYPR